MADTKALEFAVSANTGGAFVNEVVKAADQLEQVEPCFVSGGRAVPVRVVGAVLEAKQPADGLPGRLVVDVGGRQSQYVHAGLHAELNDRLRQSTQLNARLRCVADNAAAEIENLRATIREMEDARGQLAENNKLLECLREAMRSAASVLQKHAKKKKAG